MFSRVQIGDVNYAFYPLILGLGLIAGMAVNYIADVLPYRRRLVKPFCVHCQAPSGIATYFLWPRKCSQCGKPRPLRVWLVEAAYVAITFYLFLYPHAQLGILASLVLLIYFGVVTVIDFEHHLILHPVSLVGGALGLIFGVWLHGTSPTLLGGLAGYGLMFLLYMFGLLYSRWRNKRKKGLEQVIEEGLGYGDVNLAGVLGLLLGWPGIIAGLVLAILLAGAVGLLFIFGMVIQRRYHPGMSLAYGPYLVLSGVFLIFLRDIIAR